MGHRFFMNILMLVAGGLLLPYTARGQSATELLKELREKYTASPAIEVHFREYISAAPPSDTVTYTGALFLAGKRFRIETPLQTLVTDGFTVWVHNKPDSQVIIDTYRDDLFSFSPEKLIRLPLELFVVTDSTQVYSPRGILWKITLRPREAGTLIEELILWVHPDGPELVQAAVKDANGTWMHFEITDIRTPDTLPETLFRLQPPPGTDVVDLRL